MNFGDFFFFNTEMSTCNSEDCSKKTLSVVSPYPKTISTFDNEKTFPDMVFNVHGTEKKLRVHRRDLSQASTMLCDLFMNGKNDNACTSGAGEAEWKDERAEKYEEYRCVLKKWLRFCYGEDQIFEASECPAALVVVVFQLRLTYREDVSAQIQKYMKEVAGKCVKIGAEMLLKCVNIYPECKNLRIDKELAKIVLTEANMKKEPIDVIDKCLMKLPVEYLDKELVGYSQTPGDENDEFHIRMKYVKYHEELKEEEKREIMKGFGQEEGITEEVNELHNQGFIDHEVYMEKSMKTVITMLQDQSMKRIEELEEAKKKGEEENGKLKAELESSKREIADSKKKLEEINNELGNANEAIGKMEEERRKMENEVGKLKIELQSSRRENEELKEEMKKKDEEIKMLKEGEKRKRKMKNELRRL